jgi:hypothetical protein
MDHMEHDKVAAPLLGQLKTAIVAAKKTLKLGNQST